LVSWEKGEKQMKVFWWQAGLHFEPESEEDSSALSVLAMSLNLVQVTEQINTSPIAADLGNENPVRGVEILS
jgi:hypothetical protein